MAYDIDCKTIPELEEKTFFHPWIGKFYDDPSRNIFGEIKILMLGQSHYCNNTIREKTNCYTSCGAMNLPLESNNYIKSNDIMQRKKQMGSDECGKYCSSFTKNVIKKYSQLVEKKETCSWKKDFERGEKYILGHQVKSSEEFSNLWNSISFYNYIQTAYQKNGSDKYTDEYNEFSLSIGCLQDVILTIVPNIIVAWGLSAWNEKTKKAMSSNDFKLDEGGKLYEETQDKQFHEKLLKRYNYWQDIVTMPSGKKIFVLIPYHPAAIPLNNLEVLEVFSKKCSDRIKEISKEYKL